MNYARVARWLIMGCCLHAMATHVPGQLFGRQRQLGSPLGRQLGPGSSGDRGVVGEVQADSRFVRENRGRREFVGADAREQRSFVGRQQGRVGGPVPLAVTGLLPEVDRAAQINQPWTPPPRNRPYAPKIVLGFTPPEAREPSAPQLRRELANPHYFAPTNRFEVLVEGRTASLRGVVADARERDLAALVVSFEPGISEVRNYLQVAPSLPPPPSPQESAPPNPPPSRRRPLPTR